MKHSLKNSFLILFCLLYTIRVFSQDSWSLTGNRGTSESNFVGTTDNSPLIFKTNNQWAGFTGYPNKNNVSFGYLSLKNPFGNGTANTALGAQALQWNSAGSGNTALGTWALEWCTEGDNNVAIGIGAMGNSMKVGNHNVAIGQKALFNNKHSENTAVGSEALFGNTEGTGLTAVGFRSLSNNTTGEFNTALGYRALSYNTTGYWNVALGSGSLQWNSTGRFNTAGGNSSLHFNQTGVENTAFGEQALGGSLDGSYNTAVGCRSLWSVQYTTGVGDSGYGHGEANTAVGYESLREITSGNWNVGMGVRSLQKNSSGSENIAIGCLTLGSNTTGYYNVAGGNHALGSNTSGKGNVAVGHQTLLNNTTGNFNTAIGYGADISKNGLSNSTAIGYGAIATASNQITIGNSNINSIRGHVTWTIFSDRRIKKDIKTNVPGLAFINKLEPVTYIMDQDELDKILGINRSQQQSPPETPVRSTRQAQVQSGFIAQDVETAAKSVGYDFNGIDIDECNDDLYGLRYSTFVIPMVKAIQELSKENDAKDAAIESLQQQIDELKETVNRLLGNTITFNPKNISVANASLEQNYPNPFNQSSVINYSLPQNFLSGKIIITDLSGRVFKQITLSEPGEGSIKIEAEFLPHGIYFYSLYVDNTLVDTKKMVITE